MGYDLSDVVVLDPAAEDIDLILLPGVAFDADCNRVSESRIPK